MGNGYLDTRLGLSDIVVAYQGNDPIQDSGKIFIAQISEIEPIGENETEMMISGEGYRIKRYNELDDNLRKFVDQRQGRKGWIILARKSGESIITYFDNQNENSAERLLTLQIPPQDHIIRVRVGIYTRNDLTILRDELVSESYKEAKDEYERNRKDKEAKEDYEFYGRIINSLRELNLPNLRGAA